MTWWSNTWIAVAMRLNARNKAEKQALAQEIVALQKQVEVLKKLLIAATEREQALSERTEILQRMAAHRVVGDAQRFLKEG